MKYAVLLLLLVGCEPDPTLQCDYCHALREGAKRYVCDQCKMTHSACDVDKAVMHYEDSGVTIRGRISYSATGLLVCPSPDEPRKETVVEVAPRGNRPPPGTLFAIITGVILFFLGYLLGRKDSKARAGSLGKACP